VASAGVAGAGVVFLTRGQTYGLMTLAASTFILHLVMMVWVGTQAIYGFAESRNSGMLELLLCTPLTTVQIVDGYFSMQGKSYARPLHTLLAIEFAVVGMEVLFLRAQGWELAWCILVMAGFAVLAGLFLFDLHALIRLGIWLEVNAKKPGQVVAKALLYVIILPLITLPCWSMMWPLMSVIKNIAIVYYARDQLHMHLRKLASPDLARSARTYEPDPNVPPIMAR
jgi:energy-converting hydrogenase Eha subunit E